MSLTSRVVFRIFGDGKVHQYLTQRTAHYMDRFVPYGEGGLRINNKVAKDYIEYQSPYAHYQYRGILYVDPVTGSSWARKDTTKVPTGKPLRPHTPRYRLILGHKSNGST